MFTARKGFFSPGFSRANSTLTQKSVWKLTRLRESSTLAFNIANHQGIRIDPRFTSTRGVIYGLCEQQNAIFNDLIYSRHANHTEQFQGKDFFSFIISARLLAGKQFLRSLWTKDLRTLLLNWYEDDERIRVGITANWDDDEAKANLFEILRKIHDLAPLPANISELFEPFMSEKFIENQAYKVLPFDGECKPIYFKYSNNELPLGEYYSDYRKDEADWGTALPEVHQAILDNNQKKLVYLLSKNPESGRKKDPWGISAEQLALYLGPLSLYRLFVESKNAPQKPEDYNARLRANLIINTWSQTDPQTEKEQLAENRSKYLALIQSPIPRRSSLHLACIQGDHSQVEQLLQAQPERIHEQDQRGYTPLLLATAHGHTTLLIFLLKKGAIPKKITHRSTFTKIHTLCPINLASTPEIMQILLKFTPSYHRVNQRLFSAIYENNVRLARYLSWYLTQWPNHKGLSALELAISLSNQHGVDMVKTLLISHDYPLVEGPYDIDLQEFLLKKIPDFSLKKGLPLNINPDLIPLLNAHNEKLKKVFKNPVKLIHESMDDQLLVSHFFSEELKIKSVIKRLETLSPEERQDLHKLFFSNFKMMYPEKTLTPEIYLSQALQDNPAMPGFINLFYHENRLIFFMTFEFFELDNHLIFHGKLTASLNEPLYNSQKLVALAFRPVVAMKIAAEHQSILVYCKAIYPGLGLAAALPNPKTKFYPQYQQNITQSLIRKIVEATGEFLEEETIEAKLQLQNSSREIDKNNRTIACYADFTGGDIRDALPICFEVDNHAIRDYMHVYKKHGIDESSIKNFTALWQEFNLSNHYFQPKL